ncbi:MAG: hypothetical protein CME62_16795 [Halobacteriovoraceae bacterium]|nr:hypothetical protein [Halobacteriovoraceae bacterium]|tara:strand:- start:4882 stop:5094 length:213 start_codon:yes stop_codon:yes gene_type:complete
MSYGAKLFLSGFVPGRLDFNFTEQLEFDANADFIIELSDSSGQMQRHFLQYNQRLKLKKQKIQKITIYAP